MFSANSGTGSNAYRNVGVESIAETAAPHQLVLMLFNGARAAIAEAKGHLERNEIAAKGATISKAISIIDGGLKASLDLSVGGQMAKNLSDLYVYMEQRLVFANLKNDRAALDEVAKLLKELGDAWASIAGAKPAQAPATKPTPGAGQAQASRSAVVSEHHNPVHTATPTPMYGASPAPVQTKHATPAQINGESPIPAQTSRPAAAVAKAYGTAAVRAQAETVAPVVPSTPLSEPAPTNSDTAPDSRAASSQSSRLAAAYGVR